MSTELFRGHDMKPKEFGLSATDVAIYRHLLYRKNDKTERCDPSVRDIADHTGLDLKTVRQRLLPGKPLRETGLVEIAARNGRTNEYRLSLPDPSLNRESRNREDSQNRDSPFWGDTPPENVPTTPPENGSHPSRNREPNKKEQEGEQEANTQWCVWLGHWRTITGRPEGRASAKDEATFAERIADGHSLDDLKLATVGCRGQVYLREKKLDRPGTILAADKVERFIELGRASGPQTAEPQAPEFSPEQEAEGATMWQQTADALRAALSESAGIWLDPVQALGVADGELWVAAPERNANWIERRYRARIEGLAGLKLRLQVSECRAEGVA